MFEFGKKLLNEKSFNKISILPCRLKKSLYSLNFKSISKSEYPTENFSSIGRKGILFMFAI